MDYYLLVCAELINTAKNNFCFHMFNHRRGSYLLLPVPVSDRFEN